MEFQTRPDLREALRAFLCLRFGVLHEASVGKEGKRALGAGKLGRWEENMDFFVVSAIYL